MAEQDPSISRLLREVAQGNRDAMDRVIPLVYDELKRIRPCPTPGRTVGPTHSMRQASSMRPISASSRAWLNPELAARTS